jgi:glycolate oxidase iron-sulfur subunit
VTDRGFAALDPCVHCGFCLPACPTYGVTGDEADSPRGRIVLMRALERGEIPASDPALAEHLDACLGCRGCEPACPSGVGYGRGLEAARELLLRARPLPPIGRLMLRVFAREALWRPAFGLGRALRATGIPARISGTGRFGFGMGMLAASEGNRKDIAGSRPLRPPPAGVHPNEPRVALFRGCIMDTLFSHVHDATRRTLEANGYAVVEVAEQACCGALHDHAGDRTTARALARRNVAALLDAADYIVVNSAGCGALLKDYGHLLGTADAERMAGKVRDVSELLAERGPRPGAALDLIVAYDAPCHLQHAQRVHAAPIAVLGAIPGLRLRLLPGADRCCGSAGIFSLLQPEMSQLVLAEKIETMRRADPPLDAVVTGNPGCVMQIGAGLRAAGVKIPVMHPVELLDRSYALAS